MEERPVSEKVRNSSQTPANGICNADCGLVSRSICVKSCFSVNRRNDCKHKYVVALHLAEDCFSIAFDSEQELQKWYNVLLRIQLGDQVTEGEELKPLYGD